jgi:transposase
VADGNGLPVAVCTESATPHEVTLVQQTLAEVFVAEPVERLIGDNAYDSDKLDLELAETGVEMIAPHRSSRKHLTQDGRPLRRYHRRWKIERLFAWLQNFRRLVTRLSIRWTTSLAWCTLGAVSFSYGIYEMRSSLSRAFSRVCTAVD